MGARTEPHPEHPACGCSVSTTSSGLGRGAEGQRMASDLWPDCADRALLILVPWTWSCEECQSQQVANVTPGCLCHLNITMPCVICGKSLPKRLTDTGLTNLATLRHPIRTSKVSAACDPLVLGKTISRPGETGSDQTGDLISRSVTGDFVNNLRTNMDL